MDGQRMLLRASLCFLVRENEVLLALGGKSKKIGAGFWNGYGGEMEPGESREEAAVRELEEESSVIVLPGDLDKVAIVNLFNIRENEGPFVCRVHAYLARQWSGVPSPSTNGEMTRPTWFPANALPRMMPADKYWVPRVLAGDKVVVAAAYRPFQQKLIGDVIVKKIDAFPIG